jgi:hypothetical protein
MSSTRLGMSFVVVVIWRMLVGRRNKACLTAKVVRLAFRAKCQVLQTPFAAMMSYKGRRLMISQSSSLVFKTACAAS